MELLVRGLGLVQEERRRRKVGLPRSHGLRFTTGSSHRMGTSLTARGRPLALGF